MNLLFNTGKQSRLILSNDWVVSYFNDTVSQAFMRIYRENLKKGTYFKKYIDKPLLSIFHENFEKALRGNEIREQTKFEHNNSLYWFTFTFSPLFDGLEGIKEILFISEDITADISNELKSSKISREVPSNLFRNSTQFNLKNPEDALADSMFNTMADNAPVMIWVSGVDSLCSFFNKPWLEFTGRSLSEEIGNGWLQGVHPEDLAHCNQTYLKSFQIRSRFEMEYRLKRFDGEYRWLLDRGIPFFSKEGEFAGFIGSCIDITERKQIESDMKSALEEKELLLKEIHHRVKNNLQIISSLLSLQSHQMEDPELIQIFQTNINRVKSIALLHDMLNISLDQSKINFKEYLKLITNYLLIIYEGSTRKIEMILEADEKIFLKIDIAIYLGLIVNELISNSLKYAFQKEESGEIQIETKWHSNTLLSLVVKDNGIGLPLNKELEEFKTLGLKLVSMLTKQLNGKISVERKKGLAFEIILPIQSEETT